MKYFGCACQNSRLRSYGRTSCQTNCWHDTANRSPLQHVVVNEGRIEWWRTSLPRGGKRSRRRTGNHSTSITIINHGCDRYLLRTQLQYGIRLMNPSCPIFLTVGNPFRHLIVGNKGTVHDQFHSTAGAHLFSTQFKIRHRDKRKDRSSCQPRGSRNDLRQILRRLISIVNVELHGILNGQGKQIVLKKIEKSAKYKMSQ